MTTTIRRVFGFAGDFTWECPGDIVGGVISLLQGWGAGAGGGTATGSGARGGGGAGGCYVESLNLAVTPGAFYAIHVAANSASSADGDESSFGATILVAKGGQAGGDATLGSPSGAAGIASTTGCIGDTAYKGGDGAAGVGSGAAGGGGGGAGTTGNGNSASGTTGGAEKLIDGRPGGNGGSLGANGGNYGGVVDASDQRRGGAGGGGNANSGTTRDGGLGNQGKIVLTYDLPDDSASSMVTVACDAATGGDDSDIDGREFDGCGTPGLAAATWGQSAYNLSNQPGNEIQIVDGEFVKVGIDEQHYEANP